MTRRFSCIVACFVALLVLSGASASEKSLLETLKADGRFKTTVEALEKTKLVELLQKETPVTLFAPTDDAWQKLPNREAILGDTEKLTRILKQHVVAKEKISLQDHKEAREVKTLKESALKLDAAAKKVNEAAIVQADLGASDGMIHVVDQVLWTDEKTSWDSNEWLAGLWNNILPFKLHGVNPVMPPLRPLTEYPSAATTIAVKQSSDESPK